MRINGLRAVRGYKKPRYRAGKPAVVAPNRLEQNFSVAAPDRIWATDITYIRTFEGWLYLAVVVGLKKERIRRRIYRSREEARADVFDSIEVFYNRQRRQARLGYLSPAAYERQYYALRIAA